MAQFSGGLYRYSRLRRQTWLCLVSSHRYKEDIKPLDKASEALFALKPVIFRLRKRLIPRRPRFGLIAEEVRKWTPPGYRNEKGGNQTCATK